MIRRMGTTTAAFISIFLIQTGQAQTQPAQHPQRPTGQPATSDPSRAGNQPSNTNQNPQRDTTPTGIRTGTTATGSRGTTDGTGSSTVDNSGTMVPRSWTRSTDLLGRPITNDGTPVGKLEDMVVDVNSGRIVYGVNSYNNVQGGAGRYYPMPWQAGRYSNDSRTFSLNVDPNSLQNAPSFTQNQWPNFADQQFSTSTFRTYNQTPWWDQNRADTGNTSGTAERMPGRNVTLASDPARASNSSNYSARWSQRPENLNRISELRGREIRSADNTRVGNISDVVVDPESGRILYAIEGTGDRRHAIPWNALQAGTDNTFRLSLNADRLQNAPTFETNTWPNMTDQRWSEDLHKYYSVDPYWSTQTGTSTTPGQTTTPRSTGNP